MNILCQSPSGRALLGLGLSFLLGLSACTNLETKGQKSRVELPPAEAEIDSMSVFPQDEGHAIDTNHSGRGDVLRVGVFLFSRKTQRSTVGDGSLIIRLLQPREAPTNQPLAMDEVYTWELNPADMRKLADEGGVVRVTTGWQYRLGLTWPGKDLQGLAMLRVEFHSVNGTVVMSQDKMVNMDPVIRRTGGSGFVRERPSVTEATTTQPARF